MDLQQITVQLALKAWHTQVTRADKFIHSLSDEELMLEIAPGRNRVIYLVGHLVAVNDTMLSLFGLQDREYAHLDAAFIQHPDKSGLNMPDIATLRASWQQSNATLNRHFDALPAADWLGRHTAMTDEDFDKDPARNKLSVLINRTSHLAYHLGQMVLVKAK